MLELLTEKREPLPFEQAGKLIFEQLTKGARILTDMDGVLLRQDSLRRQALTTKALVVAFSRLEQLGVKLGAATARSTIALEFLRQRHGLAMAGPSILEEGQAILENGKLQYLVSNEFLQFIAQVRAEVLQVPEYKPTWKTVEENVEQDLFCPGNYQWQGKARASFWFTWFDGDEKGQRIKSAIEPVLGQLAAAQNLNYQQEVHLSVHQMRRRRGANLGIIVITGKINGQKINKADGASQLNNNYPFIFVADGFSDTGLQEYVHERGGMNLGIEGSLDVSEEIADFMEKADIKLSNVPELALALGDAGMKFESWLKMRAIDRL